ncbi:MAG: RNA 2',3'-cyclic phosphodiesterase [Thermoanaerobaculia bacterium]
MRGFLGLEIPDSIREPLDRALAPMRRRFPESRWVPAANWHLTLVFLGSVEPEDLAGLDKAVPAVFAAHEAFDLELAETGTFPPRRPARVAWIGLRAPGALYALQKDLIDASAGAGFKIDQRSYSPHLTIARCRRPWPRDVVEEWSASPVAASLEPRGFAVERGCLFESVPGRRGVHYEVVRSYPLSGQTP